MCEYIRADQFAVTDYSVDTNKCHSPPSPPARLCCSFTSQGSGKYFSRQALMKPAHIAGLEHWVFREAQAAGMLCIYD